MRDEQIALIRQKCVDANPDILTDRGSYDPARIMSKEAFSAEIRFADLLLALPFQTIDALEFSHDAVHIREIEHGSGALWSIRHDDLNKQSDRCIAFLHQLFS